MEEREMEKNSLFTTLSKPENKELKGFLKIYIIPYIIVFSLIAITFWLIFTDKIKHFSDIWFVIFNIMVLFCIILYIILIPRTYRFLVKFLIPKFFKDLNKELNFENK